MNTKLIYETNNLKSETINYFGTKQRKVVHEIFFHQNGYDIISKSGDGERELYRREHKFNTDETLEINHVTKSHSKKAVNDVEQLDAEYVLHHMKREQKFKVGRRTFRARQLTIETDQVLVEVVYVTEGLKILAKSAQNFMNTILMGIPGMEKVNGVPVDVTVKSMVDDEAVYHLQLKNIEERVKLPKACKWDNYKNILERGETDSTALLKNYQKSRPLLNKKDQRFMKQIKAYRKSLRTKPFSLTGSGDDFYWLFNQKLLDLFKDTLNPVLDGHSFHGHASGNKPMHVNINFFNAIKSKLDYNDDFYLRLKRLFVYLKVMDGEELPLENDVQGGLSSSENSEYQNLISTTADQDEMLKILNRLQDYKSIFNDSRRDEIAEASFATLNINENKEIEFGENEINENGEFVNLKIWDFNTSLDLNGDLIKKFKLTDEGSIRLEIFIDRINTDYRWRTLPNGSLSSWICNIITFGACSWALQSNYGRGFFRLSDTKIAFDLTPVMKEGKVVFSVELNEDDSDVDITTINAGINPIASILSLIVSGIASWFDGIGKGMIMDGLQEGLVDTFIEDLLPWAENLNNIEGPAIEALINKFNSSGVALGANVEAEGPFPQSPIGQPDLSKIDQQGFVYSRRYLTAWLYSIVGQITEEATLNIDIEDTFGVGLPNASSFSNNLESLEDRFQNDNGFNDNNFSQGLPGSCGNPPPVRSVSFNNSIQITRTAPEVIFPKNGVVSKAGQVKMVYNFAIGAYRNSQIPFKFVTPARCYRIVRELPNPYPQPNPSPGPNLLLNPKSGIKTVSKVYKNPTDYGVENFHGDLTGRVGYTPLPDDLSGGGLPPRPMPDRPGIPGWSDFPIEYCEPPTCEWRYRNQRETAHVYLNAQVIVTADVILGFDIFSDPWLPGVRLLVVEESFVAEVNIQTVNEPFDGLGDDGLKEKIKNYCIDDARVLLDPALQKRVIIFTCPQVHSKRELVPSLVQVILHDAMNDEIKNLISFQQTGGNGSLQYEVINNQYLYWNFELLEDLSNHVK